MSFFIATVSMWALEVDVLLKQNLPTRRVGGVESLLAKNWEGVALFAVRPDESLSILPANVRHPRFPTASWAFGIGPAKSGSTAVGLFVSSSKEVLCGFRLVPWGVNASTIRAMEASFLNRIIVSGVSSIFNSVGCGVENRSVQPCNSQADSVRVIFEKTPMYSASIEAPFVASAVFNNADTRFIYTWRDPLVQDMSLYMHRKAFQRNLTYMDWVDQSVRRHQEWEQCRKQTFKHIQPDFDENLTSVDEALSDAVRFPSQIAYLTEIYFRQKCGEPAAKFRSSDLFEEIFHHRNLNRWMRNVGEYKILCVGHDELNQRPCAVRATIAQFLSLDSLSDTVDDAQCEREFDERTHYKRLSDAQPGLQSLNDIMQAQERLAAYVESVKQTDKSLVRVFEECKKGLRPMKR